MAQGVGPEFKPQYHKKKKKDSRVLWAQYPLSTLCGELILTAHGPHQVHHCTLPQGA
jgi:hypothetical protein